MRTCYYELLDVQQSADDNELKKAYRRKALQYHPDKNPHNVEEATQIFATIRAAYEVLSDPQERAWYDSHKQQILSDEPIGPDQDGVYEYEVDASVTGVTTDELLMFFNSALYTRMDDSPAGFYQIAGKVFAKIAKDEINNGRRNGLGKFDLYQDDRFESDIGSEGYIRACDKHIKEHMERPESMLFIPFGHSSTEYEYLKNFYKKWSDFSSLKSFSWKDEYMYSRNYDRRTKREVNKRNEKARQQAKNDYNKTVKRFVSFIKKLDKRMKEGAKKAEELKRMNARQKQKELKEAYKADRRNKLANAFELQNWQAVDEENFEEMEKLYASPMGNPMDAGADDIEEEEIIVYDCFLCNKRFKSERQLENHCNTKLHKRKITEVREEMKQDSMTLGLDDLSDAEDFDSADDHLRDAVEEVKFEAVNNITGGDDDDDEDSLDSINEELAKIEEQLAQMNAEISSHSESESPSAGTITDSEQATNVDICEDRVLNDLLASLNGEKDMKEVKWHEKRTKSKTKSGKSTSKREKSDSKGRQLCSTCGEPFDSRNKLFQHVKASGHAALKSKLESNQKKNNKQSSKKTRK